jgi:hypothetical protein
MKLPLKVSATDQPRECVPIQTRSSCSFSAASWKALSRSQRRPEFRIDPETLRDLFDVLRVDPGHVESGVQ